MSRSSYTENLNAMNNAENSDRFAAMRSRNAQAAAIVPADIPDEQLTPSQYIQKYAHQYETSDGEPWGIQRAPVSNFNFDQTQGLNVDMAQGLNPEAPVFQPGSLSSAPTSFMSHGVINSQQMSSQQMHSQQMYTPMNMMAYQQGYPVNTMPQMIPQLQNNFVGNSNWVAQPLPGAQTNDFNYGSPFLETNYLADFPTEEFAAGSSIMNSYAATDEVTVNDNGQFIGDLIPDDPNQAQTQEASDMRQLFPESLPDANFGMTVNAATVPDQTYHFDAPNFDDSALAVHGTSGVFDGVKVGQSVAMPKNAMNLGSSSIVTENNAQANTAEEITQKCLNISDDTLRKEACILPHVTQKECVSTSQSPVRETTSIDEPSSASNSDLARADEDHDVDSIFGKTSEMAVLDTITRAEEADERDSIFGETPEMAALDCTTRAEETDERDSIFDETPEIAALDTITRAEEADERGSIFDETPEMAALGSDQDALGLDTDGNNSPKADQDEVAQGNDQDKDSEFGEDALAADFEAIEASEDEDDLAAQFEAAGGTTTDEVQFESSDNTPSGQDSTAAVSPSVEGNGAATEVPCIDSDKIARILADNNLSRDLEQQDEAAAYQASLFLNAAQRYHGKPQDTVATNACWPYVKPGKAAKEKTPPKQKAAKPSRANSKAASAAIPAVTSSSGANIDLTHESDGDGYNDDETSPVSNDPSASSDGHRRGTSQAKAKKMSALEIESRRLDSRQKVPLWPPQVGHRTTFQPEKHGNAAFKRKLPQSGGGFAPSQALQVPQQAQVPPSRQDISSSRGLGIDCAPQVSRSARIDLTDSNTPARQSSHLNPRAHTFTPISNVAQQSRTRTMAAVLSNNPRPRLPPPDASNVDTTMLGHIRGNNPRPQLPPPDAVDTTMLVSGQLEQNRLLEALNAQQTIAAAAKRQNKTSAYSSVRKYTRNPASRAARAMSIQHTPQDLQATQVKQHVHGGSQSQEDIERQQRLHSMRASVGVTDPAAILKAAVPKATKKASPKAPSPNGRSRPRKSKATAFLLPSNASLDTIQSYMEWYRSIGRVSKDFTAEQKMNMKISVCQVVGKSNLPFEFLSPQAAKVARFPPGPSGANRQAIPGPAGPTIIDPQVVAESAIPIQLATPAPRPARPQAVQGPSVIKRQSASATKPTQPQVAQAPWWSSDLECLTPVTQEIEDNHPGFWNSMNQFVRGNADSNNMASANAQTPLTKEQFEGAAHTAQGSAGNFQNGLEVLGSESHCVPHGADSLDGGPPDLETQTRYPRGPCVGNTEYSHAPGSMTALRQEHVELTQVPEELPAEHDCTCKGDCEKLPTPVFQLGPSYGFDSSKETAHATDIKVTKAVEMLDTDLPAIYRDPTGKAYRGTKRPYAAKMGVVVALYEFRKGGTEKDGRLSDSDVLRILRQNIPSYPKPYAGFDFCEENVKRARGKVHREHTEFYHIVEELAKRQDPRLPILFDLLEHGKIPYFSRDDFLNPVGMLRTLSEMLDYAARSTGFVTPEMELRREDFIACFADHGEKAMAAIKFGLVNFPQPVSFGSESSAAKSSGSAQSGTASRKRKADESLGGDAAHGTSTKKTKA